MMWLSTIIVVGVPCSCWFCRLYSLYRSTLFGRITAITLHRPQSDFWFLFYVNVATEIKNRVFK